MGDGSDVQGDWDPSMQSEPPAALLRRAISHVEQLLGRLESPGTPMDGPGHPLEDSAGESVVEQSIAVPPKAPEAAATEPAAGAEPLASQAQEPARAETPAAMTPTSDPVYPVPSSTQAEALRVTLRAHEEANRLRAEASQLRAEAAADGERVLAEARDLADRMQAEARDRAAELVAAANREADALASAAEDESVRLRADAEEVVERLLVEGQDRIDALRADADAEIRAQLSRAHADADRIRRKAEEDGRVEAARRVEIEVASAVAEARSVADSAQAQARNILDAATASVADVRASVRTLIESLGDSLSAFTTTAGSLEVLLDLAGPDTQHSGSERTTPDGPLDGDPAGASTPDATDDPDSADFDGTAGNVTGERAHVVEDAAAESESEPDEVDGADQVDGADEVDIAADVDEVKPAADVDEVNAVAPDPAEHSDDAGDGSTAEQADHSAGTASAPTTTDDMTLETIFDEAEYVVDDVRLRAVEWAEDEPRRPLGNLFGASRPVACTSR